MRGLFLCFLVENLVFAWLNIFTLIVLERSLLLHFNRYSLFFLSLYLSFQTCSTYFNIKLPTVLYCSLYSPYFLTGEFFLNGGHTASSVLPTVPGPVLVIWYRVTNSLRSKMLLADYLRVSISFSFLVLGYSLNKLPKAKYIKAWINKGLHLTKDRSNV